MTHPIDLPLSDPTMGFDDPISAVIIGARGGIGQALSDRLMSLPACQSVVRTSRDSAWASHSPSIKERRFCVDLTQPETVRDLGLFVDAEAPQPNLIINCSGLLHDGVIQPERTFRHINRQAMLRHFDVHACGLALLVQHLIPLIPRRGRAIFATLSARVGSIEDNGLGGWFSYRASKAAQNMILKTASIEAARRWPDLALLALHPGTVDTALSKPFTKRTPADRLFQPHVAAAHLSRVISQKTSSETGGFFAWDGSPIPW